MGDTFKQIIIPLTIGAATGGFAAAPAAAGVAGSTAAATAASAGGFTALTSSLAISTGLSTGVIGGLIGATGSGLFSALTASPELPDFGNQFQQQSTNLDFEQGLGRRTTGELEGILQDGSEFEKNRAFDELSRRGEDQNRLLEISTRRDRTDQNQAEIDSFLANNQAPDKAELELLAAQLFTEGSEGLDSDLDKERVRLKQISAARGTLDSNRNRELNLRLTEIGARNRFGIRTDSLNTATRFGQGVQDIANQGFNRLLRGAGFEETQQRFDLELSEAERRFQESLRRSGSSDQRNLAFRQFQSEQDLAIARFQQQSANSRNTGLLALGAGGLGLDYFRNQPSSSSASSGGLQPTSSLFSPQSNLGFGFAEGGGFNGSPLLEDRQFFN